METKERPAAHWNVTGGYHYFRSKRSKMGYGQLCAVNSVTKDILKEGGR